MYYYLKISHRIYITTPIFDKNWWLREKNKHKHPGLLRS